MPSHCITLTPSRRFVYTACQRLARREIGTALDWHIERSDLMARRLDHRAPAWVHRVATNGRAAADIAAEVISLAGWTIG
jgi:hypothetical protein